MQFFQSSDIYIKNKKRKGKINSNRETKLSELGGKEERSVNETKRKRGGKRSRVMGGLKRCREVRNEKSRF